MHLRVFEFNLFIAIWVKWIGFLGQIQFCAFASWMMGAGWLVGDWALNRKPYNSIFGMGEVGWNDCHMHIAIAGFIKP